MIIINNNNNNDGSQFPYGTDQEKPDRADALTKAFEQVRTGKIVSRSTYITLAGFLGCLGVHSFAVKRWGDGFVHCALTLIGFLSIAAAFATVAAEPENMNVILGVCLVLACCLPISVIFGLFRCCYWFFHTDQEFEKVFCPQEEKNR